MRISLFMARCEKGPQYYINTAQRAVYVKQAVEVAKEDGSDLLVLPGWPLGNPAPGLRGNEAPRYQFQKLADTSGLSILAETVDNKTSYFQANRQPHSLLEQLIGKHTEATHEIVQRIVTALRIDGPEGWIIEARSRRIAVLLCGENNILSNMRKHGNAADLRYSDLEWPLEYDVLINPGHHNMGRWQLLDQRFAYLSAGRRTALYCTNNKYASWGTALRIYQNGELLATGDSNLSENPRIQRHDEDQWRLVTVDMA